MKKLKRIIAVIILLVFILLIGYFVNTCKRVEPSKKQDYVGCEYYSGVSENYLYIVNQDKVYYNGIKMELVTDYEDVLIVKSQKGNEYRFVIMDNEKLFDLTTKEVLFKVVYYV